VSNGAGGGAQLRENTGKYDEWKSSLNKAAKNIDASRRTIADEVPKP